MDTFKNVMKKLSPDKKNDDKTLENAEKPQDELDKISKPNETDKPKDESYMDRNLKDAKNAMGSNKSSLKTKKPNPACPQHGKSAPGSKDATEKPLQALAKLNDEGKKKDSKPNEQEKEDESNLDADLKDIKGPGRGIEMDESSPKSKMPDIASPDQEKDSIGSKDRKDKPPHPLGKLQVEDKDKDSKGKPEDESYMDRNLKDTKNAMGLNELSPKTKKPNPTCPQHGKGAPGSKDATEKPLQALAKLNDEGKKKDSKPNEQEKEDESNLDADLKDIKGPGRGIEMDESSPKSKMPDIAAPDQEKDSTGSKDRKDNPPHPLGKLQDEDMDKASEEKPEDESGIKRLMTRISDTSKAKKPDVASPEQDEDITGSKDIKDKPSHPVVKLQDEDKDKDSKEKPEDESGIKGLMTRMGISDSQKAKRPDVASPEQDEDITGSKDIKDKPSHPVVKLQDDDKDSKEKPEDKSGIKGLMTRMGLSDSSKAKKPDVASPEQEEDDDAEGSKDTKKQPSNPVSKLQDKGKKDSKLTDQGKQDESNKGPDLNDIKGAGKGMNMDEASRKSTESDVASLGKEKDDTGSKQRKETPSQVLAKLQDEAKEKDSKSTDKGKEDESFKGSVPSETADKSRDIALIEDTDPSMDSERCEFCSSEDADPVAGVDKKF